MHYIVGFLDREHPNADPGSWRLGMDITADLYPGQTVFVSCNAYEALVRRGDWDAANDDSPGLGHGNRALESLIQYPSAGIPMAEQGSK
jgi:hypothetical protein